MTPIGHTLTGLAIGYLAIPRDLPARQKFKALAVFAVVASIPDFPFPFWGHRRFEISHSVVVTTCGVLLAAGFLLWKYRGQFPFTPTMLFAGALAWYSHLLLDTMYNRAIGMPTLWPIGVGRVALPVPWLSIGNKADIFSMHNVRVAVLEILTFGPLLLLAFAVQKYRSPRVPGIDLAAATAVDPYAQQGSEA